VPEAPQLTEAEHWLTGRRLPEEVAVAWSGGVDSTALLLALHTLGHQVYAWHIDHAWHAASERHGRYLQRQADVWGIPFCTARVSIAPTGNREAEARRARMNQFVSWSDQHQIYHLCLGHHREDQAETVCLRLLQGSGVSGCRGMTYERQFNGLHLLRPLLHIPKSELEGVLRRVGVGWLKDPSNEDASLWRNRVRQQLFPQMREAGMEPVSLFLRWQHQAERVFSLLERQMNGISLNLNHGVVSVNFTDFASISPAVRALLLQRMMGMLMGEGKVLGRRHIDLVERWLLQGAHGGLDLTRCRMQRWRQSLNLSARRVSLR